MEDVTVYSVTNRSTVAHVRNVNVVDQAGPRPSVYSSNVLMENCSRRNSCGSKTVNVSVTINVHSSKHKRLQVKSIHKNGQCTQRIT